MAKTFKSTITFLRILHAIGSLCLKYTLANSSEALKRLKILLDYMTR